MKSKLFSTVALLTTLNISLCATAENITHTSQLLSTRQCSQCELMNAGLALADLQGADLRGADLRYANLSRTNLTGANLSGADLSGASLNGANLAEATLIGANLYGTDLRDAYLVNANLIGTSLETAYVQGAVGIPNYAGTPEHFHGWGVVEAERGNYRAAIDHYNQAVIIDPTYAPAYLGRGLARYRMGDEPGATQDATIAEAFFENQEDEEGRKAAENFLKAMEISRNPKQGGGGIERWLGGLGSLLLRFIL